MKLPSTEECMQMLKDENTPDNIMAHTLMVEKVAVFLAKSLIQKGEKIDIDLISRGALLHDLKKWESINKDTDKGHGILAQDALSDEYPEVAEIVKKHMLYEILDPGLKTWEEKIVSYADKRVKHDKIVSLEERFEYLDKRYPPKDKQKRAEVKRLFMELESEIFSLIKKDPNSIKNL